MSDKVGTFAVARCDPDGALRPVSDWHEDARDARRWIRNEAEAGRYVILSLRSPVLCVEVEKVEKRRVTEVPE